MSIITKTIYKAGQVIPVTSISDTDYGVARDVVLVSTDDQDVFTLTGSDHDVVVRGFLQGKDTIGIGNFDRDGGGLTDANNRVVVDTTGGIDASGFAIAITAADSEIINRGDIQGFVLLQGSGRIVNSGLIQGEVHLNVLSEAPGPSSIVNSGTISGSIPLQASAGRGQTIEITNTAYGRITSALPGGESFFSGGLEKNLFTNRGFLQGNVVLGRGDDVFDNRGGKVTAIHYTTAIREPGTIFGDEGSDRFLPGSGLEVIDGSTRFVNPDGTGTTSRPEIDTLDFRSGAGLRVSLRDADGSGNTGRAKGDTYIGIERILGSMTGDDILIGDGQDNTLQGFVGDDRLVGGSGADDLRGGGGLDTLLGGEGQDTFGFTAPDRGVDRILDWGFEGTADRIAVHASGFGGGLAAGAALTNAQFEAQLTSEAQTAGVRFIWETDATRLWFDGNGNAAGGLTLIADLQAGAALAQGDILLV